MKDNIINLYKNSKIDKSNDVEDYSDLLFRFTIPFDKQFINLGFDFIEMIEFSIIAWNIGNFKSIMGGIEDKINETFNTKELKKNEVKLLKKLIEDKVNLFSQYDRFIVDFDIYGIENDDPILHIITQNKDEYINTIRHSPFEHAYEESNFEQGIINRSAIILTPLQPFFDWKERFLNNKNKSKDSSIYLVSEELDTVSEIEKWLKRRYDKFFCMELEDYTPNKKLWPQSRTYKLFKQWFNIEFSTMIFDHETEPIYKLD